MTNANDQQPTLPLPTPVSPGEAPRQATPPTNRAEQVAHKPPPPRAPNRAPGRERRETKRGRSNGDANEIEVATDFLPLTYGARLPPLESGQVVRVTMPRSALVSFGLPMNLEHAGEPVKADVLLGEDGMVRAIRFVR